MLRTSNGDNWIKHLFSSIASLFIRELLLKERICSQRDLPWMLLFFLLRTCVTAWWELRQCSYRVRALGMGFCVWSLFSGVVLDVLSSLTIFLLAKRELIALLKLCCGFLCSVSLPHGTMDWPVACDCGISWSYALTFWKRTKLDITFRRPLLIKRQASQFNSFHQLVCAQEEASIAI